MRYEPIKKSLGVVFKKQPFLRIFFYKLLDLLLLRAWHFKRELKKIKSKLPQKAAIFDGGAGFGQYTYFLSTLSPDYNITGVDIMDDQVRDCNEFFGKIGKAERVKFQYGDLTQYSNPGAYDLVISVDVMEHILDDIAVFKNFYASLKTNGMLVISTPSDQGGSDVHDDHDESFVSEHVRDGYNINDIKEKLKFAGFSKVEARFTYGTPGKISWLFSMKYPIILINVSKLFFIILPFYYLITYPFCLVLNWLDVHMSHKTGTGLLVKAWK